VTAASYEWQRRFTHPWLAFAVVWLRVLSNVAVLTVIAGVLVNYLGQVAPLPAKPAMLGFFTLVFVLNYVGVRIAARVQTMLMILLLALLVLFVATGAPHARPQLFVEAVQGGWAPVLLAAPLMIQLFLGIETCTEVGDEVRDAERMIPLAIVLALTLTMIVYGAIAFTGLSLVGPTTLATAKAPLVAAAQVSMGAWAKPVIVTAAVLALAKSLNAIFLVFTRFLYAMGKSGALPGALGRVDPRFGTPTVATIAAYVACIAGLALPSNLVFLLLAVNIPTMLKYFGSCLAAFNAAGRQEVTSMARIRLAPVTIRVLALAGMAAALALAALGVGADWKPYVLLLVWLAVGLVYFSVRRRAVRALG
jgi:APA family basic amino acid/polyamine antiporter